MTVDWQDNFEEGQESQEQVKDDDTFTVCSNWDANLEEQDQKNLGRTITISPPSKPQTYIN